MSDPEPRRSIRATKGQHKALEQLDQAVEAPKRRGGKKGKKAAPEPEEPEEEIIRCVCGATEQDEDSGEPWIACDQCGAWQHNICMGMSQYTEDLPKEYFCEQCRPENHKELLAGLAKGEKPWEARRKAYEEEKAEKKKRGAKRGNKKRTSDPKDEASSKSKASPPPPAPAPSEPPKKEAKSSGQKRKAAEGHNDKEAKKIRKVTETQAVQLPAYTPPQDLPGKITELLDTRQGPAKALSKSLTHAISTLEKKGSFSATDGVSLADRAERLALQIERAVHDSHPNLSAYTSQVRTLSFNLKTNPELASRLLERTLTPPMLAAMTTEELASKELQRETAEMKARAEKQAIKITDDLPRIRKTHKGEEVVGDDGVPLSTEDVPSAPVRRPSTLKQEPHDAAGPGRQTSSQPSPRQPAGIDTHQSPTRTDFDINKVFSSVKSPTVAQYPSRPSIVTAPPSGPGVDPEVDRLLDDGSESPPYSPQEENHPDIVWRGKLVMNTIADFSVYAKHAGGARLNETIGLPWDQLIPKSLTVCGRIDEQQAIVYLCSLRYSMPTDVVVVSLEPSSPSSKADMQRLIDYFVSKKRYGVVGDKGVANVRDTYLVPVLPGTGNHPEFMLNLADNFIPQTRAEPMLLAVFVYRNDPETMQRIQSASDAAQAARKPQVPTSNFAQSPATPTPGQPAFPPVSNASRKSMSAPVFSPTSPQEAFPNSNYATPRNSDTPSQAPPQPARPGQPAGAENAQYSLDQLQRQGEAIAREVLGPLANSPTVAFLLPQAHNMNRREWELIRDIYERDPRAREDLPHLGSVLEAQSTATAAKNNHSAPPAPKQQQPPPQQAPPPQHPHPLAHHQPTRHIPPPPIPHVASGGPPRQTPIPPPPIPPHTQTATGPPA